MSCEGIFRAHSFFCTFSRALVENDPHDLAVVVCALVSFGLYLEAAERLEFLLFKLRYCDAEVVRFLARCGLDMEVLDLATNDLQGRIAPIARVLQQHKRSFLTVCPLEIPSEPDVLDALEFAKQDFDEQKGREKPAKDEEVGSGIGDQFSLYLLLAHGALREERLLRNPHIDIIQMELDSVYDEAAVVTFEPEAAGEEVLSIGVTAFFRTVGYSPILRRYQQLREIVWAEMDGMGEPACAVFERGEDTKKRADESAEALFGETQLLFPRDVDTAFEDREFDFNTTRDMRTLDTHGDGEAEVACMEAHDEATMDVGE